MNKELKDRVFEIPEFILNKLSKTVMNLNGQFAYGKERAEDLLQKRRVKYGQLKRIIHDFQNVDKVKDRLRYELYGGQEMENWAKQHLQGERDLISSRKDGEMRADNISGVGGKNSHLKKHSKKPDFLPPINLVKSNSHKNSISSLKMGKLFEEVDRIKKLML